MTNLVKILNNQVITASNQISDAFGKRHCDVIRRVESLDIPEDFKLRNFASSEYSVVNELGKTVKYKSYNITRDGFVLLAMGFTGKKAMEFKIKYIEAFNKMEKALTSPNNDLVEVKPFLRRKPSGKKEITLSERARQELGGIVKAVVNKALDDRLKSLLQPELALEVEAEDSNDVLRTSWYNISDKSMLDYLQRWYGTKNYDHVQAITRLNNENDELKSKLRVIQKAVA